jgi:hypothetical protein
LKRSLLLFLLIFTATVSGCSDDPAQPDPETVAPVTWQRHALQPGQSSERVMGLSARDGDLFVLAQRFFTNVDIEGNVSDQWLHHISVGRALPFVSKDYFIYPLNLGGYFSHNSISINWSAPPDGLPASVQLPLTTLDPALSENARYAAWDSHTNVAVVNDEGLMLVPVFDSFLNAPSPTYLYLVRLSPRAPGDFSEISADLEKRIDWPYGPVWVILVGNRFFASTVVATYEVFKDGTITELFEPGANSMIEHDKRLVISNWNGISASTDGGSTWEFVVGADRGTLFEIDGRLCLWRGARVQTIDLEAGTKTTLAYDGLPTSSGPLEAAAQFGDRIYVGTREGLYHKPISEFFIPHVSD